MALNYLVICNYSKYLIVLITQWTIIHLHQYYGRLLNGRWSNKIEDFLSLGFNIRVFVLADIRVLHDLFADRATITLY